MASQRHGAAEEMGNAGGLKPTTQQEERKDSVAAPTAGVKRAAEESEEHGSPLACRRRVDPDLTPAPLSHESTLCKSGELIDAVCREFAVEPDKLEEFKSILSDFRDGSDVDKYALFNRMQAVFDGHPNLIDGFNELMAMAYEVAFQQGSW